MYREFMIAFKEKDFKTIKSMWEPQFYSQFTESLIGIEKRGGVFDFQDENIKMKYK